MFLFFTTHHLNLLRRWVSLPVAALLTVDYSPQTDTSVCISSKFCVCSKMFHKDRVTYFYFFHQFINIKVCLHELADCSISVHGCLWGNVLEQNWQVPTKLAKPKPVSVCRELQTNKCSCFACSVGMNAFLNKTFCTDTHIHFSFDL